MSIATLKRRSSSATSGERPSSETSASSVEAALQDEKPHLSQDKADTALHPRSMSAIRQDAADSQSWVSRIYVNGKETFDRDGSTWIIGDPICEDKEESYDDFAAYARGIFKCTRVGDDDAPPAIMKIYLQ